MTITTDSETQISSKSSHTSDAPAKTARRKSTAGPVKTTASAIQLVEKLEAQNHEAGRALHTLSSLWLSADAKRKRGEAEIALGYFDAALAALRKSMAAM